MNGDNLFTTPFNWIFGKIQFFENCQREFHFCWREIDNTTFASAFFCQREIIWVRKTDYMCIIYIICHTFYLVLLQTLGKKLILIWSLCLLCLFDLKIILFLFDLKSSFRYWDIQIFLFSSSPLFFAISHCFRGWFKKNLKIYDVINCLNKNLIAHLVWYIEKEIRPPDIETLSTARILNTEHFAPKASPRPLFNFAKWPKTAIACKKLF